MIPSAPHLNCSLAGLEDVSNQELEALLTRAYVGGGFTHPDLARLVFKPESVRARGPLIHCRDTQTGELCGVVVVVHPDAPARRLAEPHEAELQALAVAEAARGRGIGTALVQAAMDYARQQGYSSMILWTQSSMHAAHRLYERVGFQRVPLLDWTQADRHFLVYRCPLIP